MNTIEEKKINEIIIKNSKFITIITPINNKNDIDKNIKEAKNTYKKATHYCYAYILNEYKKSSDDGEPGGTAGIPLLLVLEKNNLSNILVITVRYFGGIKLGAGGLVRAYNKSATEVLKLCKIKEIKNEIYIKITFKYEYQKQIDYILKDIKITSKEFNEQINYYFYCTDDIITKLKNYNFIKIDKIKIEN